MKFYDLIEKSNEISFWNFNKHPVKFLRFITRLTEWRSRTLTSWQMGSFHSTELSAYKIGKNEKSVLRFSNCQGSNICREWTIYRQFWLKFKLEVFVYYSNLIVRFYITFIGLDPCKAMVFNLSSNSEPSKVIVYAWSVSIITKLNLPR